MTGAAELCWTHIFTVNNWMTLLNCWVNSWPCFSNNQLECCITSLPPSTRTARPIPLSFVKQLSQRKINSFIKFIEFYGNNLSINHRLKKIGRVILNQALKNLEMNQSSSIPQKRLPHVSFFYFMRPREAFKALNLDWKRPLDIDWELKKGSWDFFDEILFLVICQKRKKSSEGFFNEKNSA